jgi:hypothetical protein
VVGFRVDDQTLEACRAFIADLTKRLDNIPMFTTDELGSYMVALWENYRTMPDLDWDTLPFSERSKVVNPDLDYAIFHKERRNGHVVKTHNQVIFGDEERIRKRLKGSQSKMINTSFIERFNGTLRQHDGNLHRKSQHFAKEVQFLIFRLAIIIAYYNFVRSHGTLSRNPDRSITPRTPAQVKGITDSLWSIKELLSKPVISTIV